MTAVYTRPKDYEVAKAQDYLTGEDQVLYNGLGQVYFQPSTHKLNALAQFQLGLQLMHVFWYDVAIQKFQKARALDPNFAMAYWGEAMCYKQPLWQTEDLAAAQAVLAQLAKSQAMKYATPREMQYVAAAQALFAANTPLQNREKQYTALMRTVWMDNQYDADACALTGLSLMGQLYSVGNYANNNKTVWNDAKDVLEDCVAFFPNHAGAWHYQTHWLLDFGPQNNLSSAQAAALKLAMLAPESNVAQHMVSHVALRSGDWAKVVQSNQAAVAASDSYCDAVRQGNDCDADNRWHALEWQLYGKTQQCGAIAASTTFARMQIVAASMNYTGDYSLWLYRTYAHLQLQSLNSLGAIGLHNAADNATSMLPPALYDTAAVQNAANIMDHFWPPHAESHALLARIYALTFERSSAQLQAANATVTAALTRLDAIVATQTGLAAGITTETVHSDMLKQLTIVQLQAKALVGATSCAANLTVSCNATLWVALMEQALVLHTNISGSTTLPTLKIAPTPEFYGNLLMITATNYTGAKMLFERCLQELPGRMQCVLGLARASAKLNAEVTLVQSLYNRVVAQCAAGDKAFPALKEALSRLPSPSPPPSKKGLLHRALREEAAALVQAAMAA